MYTVKNEVYDNIHVLKENDKTYAVTYMQELKFISTRNLYKMQ